MHALAVSSPAPLLFSQRATLLPCMLTLESWKLPALYVKAPGLEVNGTLFQCLGMIVWES